MASRLVHGRTGADRFDDLLGQGPKLGALQLQRKIAGIAVARVDRLEMRRIYPGVELGANRTAPVGDPFSQNPVGRFLPSDRKVAKINRLGAMALDNLLRKVLLHHRVDSLGLSRKWRRPVEILLGIDRNDEPRAIRK